MTASAPPTILKILACTLFSRHLPHVPFSSQTLILFLHVSLTSYNLSHSLKMGQTHYSLSHTFYSLLSLKNREENKKMNYFLLLIFPPPNQIESFFISWLKGHLLSTIRQPASFFCFHQHQPFSYIFHFIIQYTPFILLLNTDNYTLIYPHLSLIKEAKRRCNKKIHETNHKPAKKIDTHNIHHHSQYIIFKHHYITSFPQVHNHPHETDLFVTTTTKRGKLLKPN